MKKLCAISMFIITVSFNICYASQFFNKIDISGKILDKDGNLFTQEVILVAELNYVTYPDILIPNKRFEDQIKEEKKTFEMKVAGGIFSWKLSDATDGKIYVIKDGYHGTSAPLREKEAFEEGYVKSSILDKDIVLCLIPKGSASTLEFTRSAEIIYDDANKIKYGWSFKKRWYFPINEEDVDITFELDENGKEVYRMKAPGGFVYFPGYPEFESKKDELSPNFDLMPEAPKEGYVQLVSPSDHFEPQSPKDIYYYFKTSDGKYGKIYFSSSGRFNYYLQPDRSRNLEAGEVNEVGPTRPEYRERLEKEQRGY